MWCDELFSIMGEELAFSVNEPSLLIILHGSFGRHLLSSFIQKTTPFFYRLRTLLF